MSVSSGLSGRYAKAIYELAEEKKLLTNNVLVLEFNRRGILLKKDFYTMKDMNDIKVAEDKTDVLSQKDTFVRSIMNTLRQKINDPLGKRQAK